MVVRERAALERHRCLNPVIRDMPQIFSLSFTVSPRHYAARSRIAGRVSSCSLALPQVNLLHGASSSRRRRPASPSLALFLLRMSPSRSKTMFPRVGLHVGSPRDRLSCALPAGSGKVASVMGICERCGQPKRAWDLVKKVRPFGRAEIRQCREAASEVKRR